MRRGSLAIASITSQLKADHSDKIVWVPGDPGEGGEGGATEKMLHDFDPRLCERACRALGFDGQGGGKVLPFMKRTKGAFGRILAHELVQLGEWPKVAAEQDAHWPAALVKIIRKLDSVLPKLKAMA